MSILRFGRGDSSYRGVGWTFSRESSTISTRSVRGTSPNTPESSAVLPTSGSPHTYSKAALARVSGAPQGLAGIGARRAFIIAHRIGSGNYQQTRPAQHRVGHTGRRPASGDREVAANAERACADPRRSPTLRPPWYGPSPRRRHTSQASSAPRLTRLTTFSHRSNGPFTSGVAVCLRSDDYALRWTVTLAGRADLLGVARRISRLRWCDGAGEDGGAERVDRYRHLHHHLVVKLAWDNEAECVVVCFVGLEVNSPIYLID